MSRRSLALRVVLRWVLILAFSVWFGGFTFYGAVVLPVLHGQLDQLAAGSITREVAYTLNLIGLVAIGLLWVDLRFDRQVRKTLVCRYRLRLLSLISILQVGLLWGHSYLGHWLDEYGLRGFYRVHTMYLNSATVQWGASLILMGLLVLGWCIKDESERVGGTDELHSGIIPVQEVSAWRSKRPPASPEPPHRL